MKVRTLEIIGKSILKYGFLNGLSILYLLNKCKKSPIDGSTTLIKIRKLDLNLLVRNGTSDRLAFIEVFIDEIYAVDAGKPVEFIVDAGANVGYAALYFSRKFPDSTILSIEPESTNFNLLIENIKQCQNIKALKCAVTGTIQMVKIFDSKKGNWAYRIIQSSDEVFVEEVQGYSLSSLLDQYDKQYIDILKMDIEGAEKFVFQEDCSVFKNVRHMLVELHAEAEGCMDAFFSCMSKHKPVQLRGKGPILTIRF